MARRFLELGAGAVICGRRAEVLEGAAEELRGGGAVETHACDIRAAAAVDAVVRMTDA